MNNTTLLIIAAAAGAFLIYKAKHGSANTVNNLGTAINGISEIFTGATAGSVAAGWRYFTDGTSISPNGTYYMNGVEVWTPN